MDKDKYQHQPLDKEVISIVVCTQIRLDSGKKLCGGSQSHVLIEVLRKLLSEEELDIPVREQVCFGRCEEGIVMRIAPGKEFFSNVTKDTLPNIINQAKKYLIEND